jgi:hypothetical protein
MLAILDERLMYVLRKILLPWAELGEANARLKELEMLGLG